MNSLVNTSNSTLLLRGLVWAWLAALLIVSAFLRVQGMDDYHYSPDESMLAQIAAGHDAREVLQYSLYESHPPAGNFIHHYWMQINDTPLFMRSESVLIGLILIVVYYAIGNFLGGPVSGLCCAALIAFGRGCIIQSSVMRNYIFFLFFLSCGFYCFLHWRKHGKVKSLLGYTCFGCLAGATHFSALFTFFCMGACQTIGMLRRKAPAKEWALWLAANATIVIIIGALYYIWLPMLKLLQMYFTTVSMSALSRMAMTLLYPLGIMLYILPSVSSTLPLTFGFLALACRRASRMRQTPEIRFQFILVVLGIGLGMALFIANIYTPIGGRHSFWVFPFIIPALGWLLADIGIEVSHRAWHLNAFLLVLFLGGLGMYNASERFFDDSEYAMTRPQYDAVEQQLGMLGPHDLIVMERDDAVMFETLYPLLGDSPYTGVPHATWLPHLHTHILFDPFFRRIYDKSILLEMFQQAEQKHMLDGIQSLTFFYSLWPHSIAAQLMLCPQLDKQVVIFPPLAAKRPLTANDIHHARAALMRVAWPIFKDNILKDVGKAQICLKHVDNTDAEDAP